MKADTRFGYRDKTIVTRRLSLAKPGALVLAGDDKNKTVWFAM